MQFQLFGKKKAASSLKKTHIYLEYHFKEIMQRWGVLSQALISKLVGRKGEGAAAEGYTLHIRPPALTV